jgi:hypothetical protein
MAASCISATRNKRTSSVQLKISNQQSKIRT